MSVTYLFLEERSHRGSDADRTGSLILRCPIPAREGFQPLRKLWLALGARRVVASHRGSFDVVHINGDNGSLVAGLRKVPTLVTLHGSVHDSRLAVSKTVSSPIRRFTLARMSIISRMLENFAVRRASVVVAVSQQLATSVSQRLGRSDVAVIRNGVDPSVFQPTSEKEPLRRRLGLPPGVPLALWVGKRAYSKGLDIAIRAVESTSRWQLVVVGLEPTTSSRRVIGKGRVDTVTLTQIYAACDVMLVTSRYEGFSVAVQEGMASGLPLVIRSTLSNAEVVTDGEGFLADRDEDFATILSRLEDDPARIRAAAKAARRGSIRLSADAMADRYASLMTTLVTREGSVARERGTPDT